MRKLSSFIFLPSFIFLFFLLLSSIFSQVERRAVVKPLYWLLLGRVSGNGMGSAKNGLAVQSHII